jgi:nucleoside-diphosphate-sugar epimerase
MAAANSSGAEIIEKTPLVHLTPNLIMNAHMLEAAHTNGIEKFCFISSNVVYPLRDFAVVEDDVTNEFFEKYYIVGWMKRFTELMCEMYSQKITNPMTTIIVRPGNLYGPYDKFTLRNSKVIPALIRRAIEREAPFIVWGNGEDLKDFLYIDDFIDGILSSIEKLNEFEIINIASGKSISIKELVRLILFATNYAEADIAYNQEMPSTDYWFVVNYTINNVNNFEDAVGLLIKLDETDPVDQAVIENAGFDPSAMKEDWELIRGRGAGLFTFQKITVDASDRILEKIEYPAGALAGDFARKTNYTYTSTNRNPSSITEIPYVLTNSDLLTP